MKSEKELSRIATVVRDRIEELKGVKSQLDIAREVGYQNQNMITMIKQGNAKVALDRVSALAKALDVNPREFTLLALQQFYSADTINAMLKDLGVKE